MGTPKLNWNVLILIIIIFCLLHFREIRLNNWVIAFCPSCSIVLWSSNPTDINFFFLLLLLFFIIYFLLARGVYYSGEFYDREWKKKCHNDRTQFEPSAWIKSYNERQFSGVWWKYDGWTFELCSTDKCVCVFFFFLWYQRILLFFSSINFL